VVKTPTIAIIDDDESVRSSLENLVKSLGFGVESFVSAGQFVGSNRMRDTACVILNVHLPGMGGPQLQSHLASAGLLIPIILITASKDEKTRAQAVQAGALAFLHGPSGERALLREIHSALRLAGKDKHLR
jgi:FixJ family two-component response regulator